VATRLRATIEADGASPCSASTFVVALTGGGRSIEQIFLGADDLSAAIAPCPTDSLLDGGLTRRCASVPVALFGPGADYPFDAMLDVVLDLDDGSSVRQVVDLLVLPNTEP
jgi:hypothetical protein